MGLSITTATIRGGTLAALIGTGAKYAAFMSDTEIQEAIDEAISDVQLALSTRFDVTTFKPWFGPGPRPDDVDAVGPTPGPAAEAIEYEPPYDWPARNPGDGWPRVLTRIRPVVEIMDSVVVFPGGSVNSAPLPSSWFRYDFWGEVMIAPNNWSAPFFATGFQQVFLGQFQGRIPQSLGLNYRAGLTASDLKTRFNGISRLVQLRAEMRLMPKLALKMNPSLLTSQSADGLSQSRSSGYPFKDLEDRVKAEADGLEETFKRRLDGPELVVL